MNRIVDVETSTVKFLYNSLIVAKCLTKFHSINNELIGKVWKLGRLTIKTDGDRSEKINILRKLKKGSVFPSIVYNTYSEHFLDFDK